MAIDKPMIVTGSAADLSAWTNATGTVTVTSSVSDPFGGTGAYTYSDNDAGQAEGREKAVTFTANGTQYMSVYAKQSTATGFMFGIFDNSGPGYRALISITWSGLTSAVTSGSATVMDPISVGNSWYLFRAAIPSIVAANDNRIRLYCTLVTGSLTGDTSFYMRNTALVPQLDNVVRWRDKKPGYEYVEGPGSVDAWDPGDRYFQSAVIRHIPDHDENTPANCTGFDGLNEYTGINCGWDTIIKAGQNASALLWVPDRSAASTYISSTMLGPMPGEPPVLEENNPNYRQFGLKLFNTSSVYSGWT